MLSENTQPHHKPKSPSGDISEVANNRDMGYNRATEQVWDEAHAENRLREETIVYSKNGAHIFPTNPRNWRGL
ncbi:MAG: hypothetical protein FWG63_00870 [Defluviitaleaceae bacterium]|nr:hypothetical protein [Defluviitaleaceae bacterium]